MLTSFFIVSPPFVLNVLDISKLFRCALCISPFPPPCVGHFRRFVACLCFLEFSPSLLFVQVSPIYFGTTLRLTLSLESAEVSHTALISLYIYFFLFDRIFVKRKVFFVSHSSSALQFASEIIIIFSFWFLKVSNSDAYGCAAVLFSYDFSVCSGGKNSAKIEGKPHKTWGRLRFCRRHPVFYSLEDRQQGGIVAKRSGGSSVNGEDSSAGAASTRWTWTKATERAFFYTSVTLHAKRMRTERPCECVCGEAALGGFFCTCQCV